MKKEKSLKTIGFQGFGGDWGTRKSRCRFRRAGIEQVSTGHLHLVIRVPTSIKQKSHPDGWPFFFGGDWGTRTLDLMRVKHAL